MDRPQEIGQEARAVRQDDPLAVAGQIAGPHVTRRVVPVRDEQPPAEAADRFS
jgi:hypothetical protein